MASLKDKAAIAGIGATEFSKNSGRSELQLATESVTAALADAGLKPSDVDGISTYTMDNNGELDVFRAIGGRDLKFFARAHYGGGGACAPIMLGAMAVATGQAKVVVCYRAMNERSEYRFGAPIQMSVPTTENALWHYMLIHGAQTAAAYIAMCMRRYMHETGTTTDAFAEVAMSARFHANTNPNAFFYNRPLTMDDYLASRMIADPFRKLDCCQESDGSVAVVIVSAEHARNLRQKPAMIRAAAQGAPVGTGNFTQVFRGDITPFVETNLVARQLYETSGLGPKDIQASIFYDHFGPTVLPSLEAFGFCKRGEAKDFIKNGNIRVGGAMPVNMNGGQTGEAYIHGMNGIAEAVRQIRGTAVNQVKGVHNIAVTAGSCVPTSGLILGAA